MDYVQLEKDVKRLFGSLDHCNEQVDIANDKINDVKEDVKEILAILTGNPRNKHDIGIVGRVEENEKRLEKLERFRDRAIWLIIGMALTSGYGISEIVNRIISKH